LEKRRKRREKDREIGMGRDRTGKPLLSLLTYSPRPKSLMGQEGQMKYVILYTEIAGVQKGIPLIFPDFLCHDHIVVCVSSLLREEYKIDSTGVVSAGEIDIDQVACSGYSSTLKIYSRDEEDSDLIESYDYLGGIL
jgi:hypothetical protein